MSTTPGTTSIMLFDANEVRRAFTTLSGVGAVREVRVLDGRERPGAKAYTYSGWFNNADAIVAALGKMRGGWKGVYVTLNPCDPTLMHRVANRLEYAARGTLTSDAQIVSRSWLPLDFDPVVWGPTGRITGIASTDGEKVHTRERADFVASELERAGLPRPIRADSGNGTHLLWPIDLPACWWRSKTAHFW